MILFVSGIWINETENREKDYSTSLNKVKIEYQQFAKTIDKIIAGKDVSFEVFTEEYTHLRVHLSAWNRLYNKLRIWENNTKDDTYGETSAGEVYLAIEELYFSVVHMYYIKDKDVQIDALQNNCKDINNVLEGF